MDCNGLIAALVQSLLTAGKPVTTEENHVEGKESDKLVTKMKKQWLYILASLGVLFGGTQKVSSIPSDLSKSQKVCFVL